MDWDVENEGIEKSCTHYADGIIVPDEGFDAWKEKYPHGNIIKFSEYERRRVEQVRHGRWIPSPDGINPIRCSECNMPAPFAAGENEFGDFEIRRYPSSYCHECGAKMDGNEGENNG